MIVMLFCLLVCSTVGLHVIDFEQLKIENQSLQEKIQERSDEILKLKRKRTGAIQVIIFTTLNYILIDCIVLIVSRHCFSIF
jgi:hypothetical protein